MDTKYIVMVSAQNAAGLVGQAVSGSFKVASDSKLSTAEIALIVAGGLVFAVLVISTLFYFFWDKR